MMLAAMVKLKDCNCHGGSILKPHRIASFGEVSNAPTLLESDEKQPIAAAGTAIALDYSNKGVAADLARRAKRGGARNKRDRASYALTAAKIASLSAAQRHAGLIGLPFTRMVTIHWKGAGVALEDMAWATGRFVGLLAKALSRHGSRTAWLWVHENGASYGWHCHLLVHVPANLVPVVTRLQRGWLRRITGKAYRAEVIHSKPIGGRLGLEVGNPALHADNLARAFGYHCKAAPQTVLDAFGIERQHQPGGLILGRRCSTSQNIAEKARKAKDPA